MPQETEITQFIFVQPLKTPIRSNSYSVIPDPGGRRQEFTWFEMFLLLRRASKERPDCGHRLRGAAPGCNAGRRLRHASPLPYCSVFIYWLGVGERSSDVATAIDAGRRVGGLFSRRKGHPGWCDRM